MTLRFLIDAQLPRRLCARLSAVGIPAVHVKDVLSQSASDQVIWDWAIENDAVIMTKDDDFALRMAGGSIGPVVVWVRLGNVSNAALWESLKPCLPGLLRELAAGTRVVEIR